MNFEYAHESDLPGQGNGIDMMDQPRGRLTDAGMGVVHQATDPGHNLLQPQAVDPFQVRQPDSDR
jgi:hypothetical protein